MGYKIGMSSGMFGTAQGKEKLDYLTVLKKVMWSATKGVTFSQLDIESITEFNEPFLEEEVRKIKQLGIEFGIHGEMGAMGMQTMTLDSAKPTEYRFSHLRLIKHIEGAGKMGAKYCLVHASESEPLILLESRDLAMLVLVDIWGRAFTEFLEDHPELVDWGVKQKYITDITFRIASREYYISENIKEFKMMHKGKEPTAEERRKIEKETKDWYEKYRKEQLIKGVYNKSGGNTYGPERVAYILVGKWMCDGNNCPTELRNLWKNIVGNKSIDDIGLQEFDKWGQAVSAAYIWGHFHPETRPRKSKIIEYEYEDPKPLLEKYKLLWVFETAMAKGGYEGHIRLGRIPHMYYLAKSIKSPWISVALDAEHLLSCNIDPMKEVKDLPYGAGERIRVIHMGFPTPHAPGHIPIAIGSKAQEYWYKLLYILREKGMENGYFIFERAGLPVEESTVAIKLIAEHLEKDIKPKDLPLEFYGMPEKGPRYAIQKVSMEKHALDPLKDLLYVPEEEYGLLGKSAAEKGKAEIWKKREVR